MPKASDAFPELFIPPDRQGRVKTDTSSGRKMDKKIDELITRLNKLGFKYATVVNINPFPVETDLGYNGRFIVKGCKAGEPYVAYVIKKPLFYPIEKAEGDRDIDAIMPIEQAVQFTKEMRNSIFSDQVGDDREEEGFDEQAAIGVFWFEGVPGGADGKGPEFPNDLFLRARELQQRWFGKLFEEAENQWAKSQNRREIHDRMRDAARYMLSIKAIDALPPWVTAKADVKGAEQKKATLKSCPLCGKVDVPVGAAICGCDYMFDAAAVKKLAPERYYQLRPNEPGSPHVPPGGAITSAKEGKPVVG